MIAARLVTLILFAAAMAAGAAWLLQRQSAAVLREEIGLLESNRRALATLRAENDRLRQQQPSDAELGALRADHAAAMRLRSELNALREQIAAAEAKTP